MSAVGAHSKQTNSVERLLRSLFDSLACFSVHSFDDFMAVKLVCNTCQLVRTPRGSILNTTYPNANGRM